MKTKVIGLVMVIMGWTGLYGQKNCSTSSYRDRVLQNDPSLAAAWNRIESFTNNYINNQAGIAARDLRGTVIKIPVVVHILYHFPEENISDAQVIKQLDVLNKTFRRRNADTSLTPPVFAALAADCEIEFELAVSDPRRRNTSGIIRKYTPIKEWQDNDEMKFNATMGDDAWDTKSYLNIWVCKMTRVAGYSSIPGADPLKDGVVLATNVFGSGRVTGLDMGKTAVHEVGHWLNLQHLWGDEYCGDDKVNDTPKQGGYTAGCPNTTQISCNNSPYGNMYMNYMDFTNDACMNMFTQGQKLRMRALFETGGPRSLLLSSTGLQAPLVFETPLPEEPPRWLYPQVYPNPARDEIILDIAYDIRWIGKTIHLLNLQGQVVLQLTLSAKVQSIPLRSLSPGLYILRAQKEDGEIIQQKFVKL